VRICALIRIETQANRAQRSPGRVALDDAATLLDPYPGIVTIAEPILDVIRRGLAAQMPGQRLPVGRQILGMYSRRPQLLVSIAGERRELGVLAPIVDPRQPVVHDVPIPKTDLGTP